MRRPGMRGMRHMLTVHSVQHLPGDDLPRSVVKILSGAIQAIASRGAKRLSMSDIIDASNVSRGTLYRYFSNKDEVLAAVAEYICTEFERGIADAGNGIADPVERMRAVLRFYARYTLESNASRLFEVEPAFHLAFFRNRFARYESAVQDALEPFFAHADAIGATWMDRAGTVDIIIRTHLSSILVPIDQDWIRRWEAMIARFADLVRVSSARSSSAQHSGQNPSTAAPQSRAPE
jgi:AcrR family transcriptional regulator